jgi:hypothetical protein
MIQRTDRSVWLRESNEPMDMMQASCCPKVAQPMELNGYLSRDTAFYLLASITVSFLASSSARPRRCTRCIRRNGVFPRSR